MEGDKRQGQLDREQRQQLLTELQENREGVRQQLQVAEAELEQHERALEELRTSASQVDPAELDRYRRQVAELQREVDELAELNRQYASADSRVTEL